MYWFFLSDLNWLFLPDSEWLISPDANNRESVIDEALKLSRFKLENAWNIDKKLLDEIDECYV